MASFSKDLTQINTSVTSPLRAVEDNSTAQLLGGLGTEIFDGIKKKAGNDFRSSAQDLKDSFISENNYDPKELSGITDFSKRIQKLKQMAKASGKEDEFRIRGEALLKTHLNKFPGLSREFRAISGEVLGFDPNGETLRQKQAEVKKAAFDAEKELESIEKDSLRMGFIGGEVFTQKGQSEYLAAKEQERKLSGLTQMLDYNIKLARYNSAVSGGKGKTSLELLKDRYLASKYQAGIDKDNRTKNDLVNGINPETIVSNFRGSTSYIVHQSGNNARNQAMDIMRKYGLLTDGEAEATGGFATTATYKKLEANVDAKRDYINTLTKAKALAVTDVRAVYGRSKDIPESDLKALETKVAQEWDNVLNTSASEDELAIIKRQNAFFKENMDKKLFTNLKSMTNLMTKRMGGVTSPGQYSGISKTAAKLAESLYNSNANDGFNPYAVADTSKVSKGDVDIINSSIIDGANKLINDTSYTAEEKADTVEILTQYSAFFKQEGKVYDQGAIIAMLDQIKDPQKLKMWNTALGDSPQLRQNFRTMAERYLNHTITEAGKGLLGTYQGLSPELIKTIITPEVINGAITFKVNESAYSTAYPSNKRIRTNRDGSVFVEDTSQAFRSFKIDIQTNTAPIIQRANKAVSALNVLIGDKADINKVLRGTPWEGMDFNLGEVKKGPTQPAESKKKVEVPSLSEVIDNYRQTDIEFSRSALKNYDELDSRLGIGGMTQEASESSGIDYNILQAQQLFESGFRSKALSSAKAFGLTQFIPSTAKVYGVKRGSSKEAVKSQIEGQAKYMSDLKKQFNGDIVLATLAYNQGPGNVRKYLRGKKFKMTEGRKYVKRILGIDIPEDGSKYG